MESINFKKILPHIAAVAIFYAITILFNLPEFTENLSMHQTDVLNWKGAAKETVDFNNVAGQKTTWTGTNFSGMPAYLIAVGNYAEPLVWLRNATWGFLSSNNGVAYLMFSSLISFYIMLLCFRVNPILAIAGSLSFGFMTFNILSIEAGHHTKMQAIAWAPLILGGVRLSYKEQKLLGFMLILLGFTLHMSANHLQITYYTVIACGIYGLNELRYAFANNKLKEFALPSALVIVAGLMALFTYTGRVLTTQNYTPESTRGPATVTPIVEVRINELEAKAKLTPQEEQMLVQLKEALKDAKKKGEEGAGKGYAFSWSQGKMETFTMLVPNFYGGASNQKLGVDSNYGELLRTRFGLNGAELEKYAGSAGTYWGDQPFTGGPLYFGAIVCFLFIFSMLYLDKKERWWILQAVIATAFIAWGRNFSTLNYFFFDYIPGFNKFRSVSMALSITSILMVLSVMLALNKLLIEKEWENVKKSLNISAGVVGGLCILFAITGGIGSQLSEKESHAKSMLSMSTSLSKKDQQQYTQTSIMADALQKDRASMVRKDAMRSVLFIGLSFGLLLIAINGKIAILHAVLAILLLSFLDLLGVATRYVSWDDYRAPAATQEYLITDINLQRLQRAKVPVNLLSSMKALSGNSYSNESSFKADVASLIGADNYAKYESKLVMGCENPPFPRTGATRAILKDKDPSYRVVNLTTDPFRDAGASYYHKSIGGYFAAKMQRYQELVDYYLGDEVSRLRQITQYAAQAKVPVDSIADVRQLQRLNMLNTRYAILGRKSSQVYKNPAAMGNAWFVQKLHSVEDPDDEIKKLGEVDLYTSAVINTKEFPTEKLGFEIDSMAQVKMTSYKPNEIVYEYNTANDGFLVFSEIFYKDGWYVSIDGADAKENILKRVNFVLRGLEVSKGKHTIKMTFDPSSFKKGEAISTFMTFFILFFVIFALGFSVFQALKKP